MLPSGSFLVQRVMSFGKWNVGFDKHFGVIPNEFL
jgi:hypothetical protein